METPQDRMKRSMAAVSKLKARCAPTAKPPELKPQKLKSDAPPPALNRPVTPLAGNRSIAQHLGVDD